jgi:hypothetical protein
LPHFVHGYTRSTQWHRKWRPSLSR